MKKTILILGVSSFVGSNLAEYLKNDFRVIGTFFSTPVEIPGVTTIHCDILNRDVVQMVIFTFKPDFTVYCAGLSSFEDCHQQPKYANALNTIGTFNVSTFTERYKSRLCYISSAMIFSGLDKFCTENEPPDPNTEYGKSMASTEFFVQKSLLNYLIFRTTQFYGRSINPRQYNFFEYLHKKLSRGESVTCDGHIHFGFLDIYYLAALLKMAVDTDTANRLFQVASHDYMTCYDFARLFAKIFKYDENLITKGKWLFSEIRQDIFDIDTGNNRYFKLSNDNIEGHFQIKLPTIEESLEFSYLRMGGSKAHARSSKNTGAIKYI